MVNGIALPHTLIQEIVQRAGGNPFFIEEVVRSLFEQGAIVRREGGFEVTEKAEAVTIPATITDVLMARIDRLDEPTRHLVKVASVIGRSFFFRILSEVESEVEDIPGKLAYLSEIQILQPQERLGEVEYVFKHALAQEAAYESLLPPRKRELHLKVAHAIEKIFSQRLPEFYGMLAYHYSRAEEREKTEEYLIKAGEEALRSAASDEALHYYEEALQLYLQKSGPDADPEKVAMLEKNIALALYNRGRYVEAVRYFEKTLAYYSEELPNLPSLRILKGLSAFLCLVMSLWFPFLMFKRIPKQRDIEVVDLSFKKCKCLSIMDTRRYFLEMLRACRKAINFDLKKFELGFLVFVGVSSLFFFTGISFRLSRRILDAAKDNVQEDNLRGFTTYDICNTAHNYLEGNWKAIRDYDEDLVNKNCKIGELYDASINLYYHGYVSIYQGSLDIAKAIISRLENIHELYENDIALSFKYELSTNLLIESRKLQEALTEVQQGIDFAEKSGLAGLSSYLIEMYSCQAWIYILTGDPEKARKHLQLAERIRLKTKDLVPFQISNFYRSKSEYDLYRLKQLARNSKKSESLRYRKRAIKSCKMAVKVAQKTAQHRCNSYRLMGVYCWLIDNQKEAIRWWAKAVREGERLGARLELARLYFEIGERLLEPESRYHMVDGVRSDEYLEKARVLFKEMKLQWDTDELSRVTGG